MANLFNISERYLALLNNIEENDGVLEDDEVKELEITQEELEDKMTAYYHFIQSQQGIIAAIDDEVTRLAKLKSTKDNLIKRLTTSLRDATIMFGEQGKSGNKVLDFGTIKFYTRKNEVVKIEDDFYNSSYMRYKLTEPFDLDTFNEILNNLSLTSNDVKHTVDVDKVNLKKDLQNNVEVEGAYLIRNDSIIIK